MNKNIIEFLALQSIEPMCKCDAVNELMKVYRHEASCHFGAVSAMFLLGYIEGKRAERARRKAVRYE